MSRANVHQSEDLFPARGPGRLRAVSQLITEEGTEPLMTAAVMYYEQEELPFEEF